ncbi:2-succinyl-6-hydroxy-2,4-cyclohexadiene-1-carboxylate synthase [Niallia sp. Krafla_26]|uniref:2-succinyl-6-hydroxy-2, 4-cyclohexadiene-1-carboxylate synthase n=1 Tax=Niallia sp. Krafla_26 TaxID=3064703 RepID=UPI003D183886
MYISVGNVSYFLDIQGEGFPLILLHGFTGDGSTWSTTVNRLKNKHKLVTVDIIGHGRTDSPEDLNRYDILSVANDIEEIISTLKWDTVDILGYSMGGRLALSYAMKYPHRVRKLILESSSPGLKIEEERKNRQIQDKKLAQFILEKGIEDFVDYWENIPLFSTQKTLPIGKQQEIREQRLQNSTTGLANSLLGMGTGVQPSWWDHLNECEIETLLLTGSLDQKFCSIAEQMVSKMKNVQWQVVEKSGHAIHVEHSEKFGTIIDGFLSR